jgi:hypothetical protein
MDLMTTPDPVLVPAAAQPLEGYDEDTVDDFVRAVAHERDRLRALIGEAQAREARAQMLLGLHDAMLATMRDVYREVTEQRRVAEATAAATVLAAQRHAAEIRAAVEITPGEVVR